MKYRIVIFKGWKSFKLFIGLVFALLSSTLTADILANQLQNVEYQFKGEGEAQITLTFASPPARPQFFSMELPPSLVFDFAHVKLRLPEAQHDLSPQSDFIDSISFIEDNSRTRMIVDVQHLTPVEILVFDHKMAIKFKDRQTSSVPKKTKAHAKSDAVMIQSIEFSTDEDRIGKIVLKGPLKQAAMDMQTDDHQVTISIPNMQVAENFNRSFDVHHLGTDIQRFSAKNQQDKVIISIETKGQHKTASYHLGDCFVFETRAIHGRRASSQHASNVQLTRDRISFNFQDIDLRAVLHLLAELTDMNLIVGENVQGQLSMKLDDVPFAQALDVLLDMHQLSKKEMGAVVMIVPTQELIHHIETQHLANAKLNALAPMASQQVVLLHINAGEVAEKLSANPQLISQQGHIDFDERTNTLFIKETQAKLNEILPMIQSMDVPARQVMIESQILETDHRLSDMLGIKFSGTSIGHQHPNSQSPGLYYDNANRPLHMTGKPATLSLAVANLPMGTLLDLELQALEQESKGKILARPTLLTLDKKPAVIENGIEIPFSTHSEEGHQTQFKKAVLSLSATPRITTNNQIILQLDIHKDAPSSINNPEAGPGIDTTTISTTVVVGNGQTVVLGGIYHQDEQKNDTRVPFLSGLPWVGSLFHHHAKSQVKKELLFFITPKIIQTER